MRGLPIVRIRRRRRHGAAGGAKKPRPKYSYTKVLATTPTAPIAPPIGNKTIAGHNFIGTLEQDRTNRTELSIPMPPATGIRIDLYQCRGLAVLDTKRARMGATTEAGKSRP
ncbi:MAG TPA: hypothetical protein VEF90_08705 [Xanthobacteraceae bacterium]|nr:hypothetical protein [Xanthobacteraceae bacterium]